MERKELQILDFKPFTNIMSDNAANKIRNVDENDQICNTSSQEGNNQLIDYLLIRNRENNESVIVNSSIEKGLEKIRCEYDQLNEQECIKVEFIEQVNDEDESLERSCLEEEMKRHIFVKQNTMTGKHNTIQKTQGAESDINTSAVQESEEKSDETDEGGIKTGIVAQIKDNGKTSEEVNLVAETKKLIIVEKDKNKKRKRRSTKNVRGKFSLATKENSIKSISDNVTPSASICHDNVQDQCSLNYNLRCRQKILYSYKSNYTVENMKQIVVKQGTLEKPKRRHTRNAKSKFNLINEDNFSLKSVTNDVTSSTCPISQDLICPSTLGCDLQCPGKEMLNSDYSKDSFRCGECNKSFTNKSDLQVHVHGSIHLTNNKLVCLNREKQLPDCAKLEKSDLSIKMTTNAVDEQFKCPICNKCFSTNWNLKMHGWVHAIPSAKPFKCELCVKAFIRKTDYKNHINIHNHIKPFTCEYCGCKFSRKYNYTRHRSEHQVQKKFKCDICFKLFHRSSYLREHQRMHTGERPFSCKICGMRTAAKANLNKHLKIHFRRDPL